MILFTSGFPKSGKTTFAKKLLNILDNKLCLHINPEDYYPDDFEDLPQDEKTNIATTAWELSLEKATKSICALPNKVLIIFDTCCSKSFCMRQLFINSKMRGHHIFMVFLNTPLNERIMRTGDKKLIGLEEKYRNSFKDSLPILKKHADNLIIIDNSDDELLELHKHVHSMSDKIRKLRDS